MSSCTITESFIAAVSGKAHWWCDDRQNHCAYCGSRLRWLPPKKGVPAPDDAGTRDHIIPQSRQGRLTIPACRCCNKSKGGKPFEEFVKSTRFREAREESNRHQWPIEQLWLAHAAAALQICFAAKATKPSPPATEVVLA